MCSGATSILGSNMSMQAVCKSLTKHNSVTVAKAKLHGRPAMTCAATFTLFTFLCFFQKSKEK
jgi:hypothetical protein